MLYYFWFPQYYNPIGEGWVRWDCKSSPGHSGSCKDVKRRLEAVFFFNMSLSWKKKK